MADCESVRGEWGGVCPDCGQKLPDPVKGPPSSKTEKASEWASPEGQAMTEAELKRLIVELAVRLGWETHETPQIEPRRPVKGQSKGYPDLTLARRHTVIFMELKTDTGKVSDDQWRWGIALPEWHVIRPADWNDGSVASMLQ